MGIVSLIVAIVGAVVAVLSLIQGIGFFMWIGGIVALVGVVLGIIGLGGEKKGGALPGLIIGAAAVVFAVLRIAGLF